MSRLPFKPVFHQAAADGPLEGVWQPLPGAFGGHVAAEGLQIAKAGGSIAFIDAKSDFADPQEKTPVLLLEHSS